MSPLLNAQEIERGLIAKGVPKEKARIEALRQIGSADPVLTAPDELPAIGWPVRLLIPWSYLISDNRRYCSGTERSGGGLLLTSDYRRCRGLIRELVRGKLGIPAPEPASIPLSLEAGIWVPDNRPHDCTNFAKVCHDAMEGLVYANDRWLYSAHWFRAGVDVDAPRALVTINPLLEAA